MCHRLFVTSIVLGLLTLFGFSTGCGEDGSRVPTAPSPPANGIAHSARGCGSCTVDCRHFAKHWSGDGRNTRADIWCCTGGARRALRIQPTEALKEA